MRTSILKRSVCIGTAMLLAGCGGMTSPVTPGASGMSMAHRTTHAPCPLPKVWASQLSPAQVEGYTGAGIALACTVNNGAACTGGPFKAPFGLASDSAGNLYVADVNNSRVCVFNKFGVYLATNTTTLWPRGVCVAPNGVLGVAEEGVNGTGPGMVEFFGTPLLGGAATGSATSPSALVADTYQWCAFDLAGNFFATGTTAGTSPVQQIDYLTAADVNLPAQAMVASAITTAQYWVSMYVQKKCSNTNGEVLAVANLAPEIVFFKINPGTGVPGPGGTTLPLTSYPTGTDDMDQDAPNKCSTKAEVYFADYGGGEVLDTKEYSGAIGVFNIAVPAAVGVATNPTGQE